ncbi:Penicillin-binding protein 1A [Escherichia coli]|nr:Penicillin-binding protein 1A [Escherichia coli]
MYNRYGESAYEDGYRIYTTITRKVQQAAQQAVRNNVLDYDMRHGYRGRQMCCGKWASRRGITTRLPIR